MPSIFRVPAITVVDPDDGDRDGTDLGVPATITRNAEYHPDERGLILVEDEDDAAAFRREAGYTEVIADSDVPSPPASKSRTATDKAGARSSGGKS